MLRMQFSICEADFRQHVLAKQSASDWRPYTVYRPHYAEFDERREHFDR